MKNTFRLMVFALLALSMFACGEKKLTQEDLKKAEASLFNDDKTMNMDVAPKMAEKYCRFVEQNPNDSIAPACLFKALEIYLNMHDADKSIAVENKLKECYPDSERTPVAMFLIASYIYEDQLEDLDKAREMYQKIIDDYPDLEYLSDVKLALECVGLTPEERLNHVIMAGMEEVEEFY